MTVEMLIYFSVKILGILHTFFRKHVCRIQNAGIKGASCMLLNVFIHTETRGTFIFIFLMMLFE